MRRRRPRRRDLLTSKASGTPDDLDILELEARPLEQDLREPVAHGTQSLQNVGAA